MGVILLDNTDKDYVSIVLGRDKLGVFRCIDCMANIMTIKEAREILKTKIDYFEDEAEFPQGVEKGKKKNLFRQIVSETKMLKDYKTLVDCDLFTPAKELIQEIAYSFEDPDGNYIEQFQSTGFNARLWELYLYALFHEMDFSINRQYDAPDYVIEKFGSKICVEAVTVNPSQHKQNEDEPSSTKEMNSLIENYMPIKYGSSLYSKLQKRYWEKPHVKGNPLIIAIHDFHQYDSMMWSRQALERYLYGSIRDYEYSPQGEIIQRTDKIVEHQWKGKEIPSGFFYQHGAENISAIIHSNQATIGKFLRMGFLAGFGKKDIEIKFIGQAILNNNQLYTDFDYDVNPEIYEEYWSNGLTVYHNPVAIQPVNYRLFPGAAHIQFAEDKFTSIKPQFYPVYGRTFYRKKPSAEECLE